MSQILDQTLAVLRQEFVARLPGRVAGLESQLAAVARGERQAIAELLRGAHSLVGTAGVHRLMVLSDAARRLEQTLAGLPDDGAKLTSQQMEVLRDAWGSLRQAAADPLVSLVPSQPQRKSSRRRILVVDDDSEHALWLRSVLEPQGYDVEVLTELDSFRQLCRTGELPAAVIMDMVFPQGRDAGAEAIAELKQRSNYDLPVIFVSVRQDMGSRLAAYRAGASRYLVKPLQPQVLLQALGESMPLLTERPYRVLLVDDEVEQLAVHGRLLREAGMEVRECSNPMEVLYILREFPAEVLLLDLYMPQCSGQELAAIVRDEFITQDIPVIYLSAETNVLLQSEVLARGGELFLNKPVDVRQLVTVVGTHARRYRERRRQWQNLKAARYSQQRQQQALDAHAIVSMSDAAGVITYVNGKFCEISGYGEDELLGRNHRLLKSGVQQAELYEQMWRTIRGGRIWEGELCNRHKDGNLYWLKSTIVPFMDEQGLPYQYIAIRTDITSNKRIEAAMGEARKQAEAASRSKSEFLAGISHELRTPLNAILGFAQLLARDPQLGEPARTGVQEIEQAGMHLLWLVNDLIDLARIEAGSMVMSVEPVPVAMVLEESLRMVEHMARKYGVRLVNMAGDIASLQVLADYVRLRQVLINLLSNAIKYNRSQGETRVAVQSVAGGSCRMLVSDSGPGIAPDKQALVFRAFERLGAERGAIEGAGIGLNITRRIVEAMGGTIGFESEPGRGSTFWIELTQANQAVVRNVDAEVEKLETNVQQEASETDGGPKSKVVYVEDNPMNQRLMQQIFTRRPDLELLEAGTAEVGIGLVREHLPAMVLMDINLPGMDGFEALRVLAADPQTAKIPVVAISANAMKGDEQRGLAAGFVAYLTKPLDIASLLSTLDRVLSGLRKPSDGG